MSERRPGPGSQVVVVFVALLSFALLTTVAVVALGVTSVAEAVPESPDAVPEQPGDAVSGVEAAVSGPPANATVSGTVRGPDGSPAANATVALAPSPEPLFQKATPSELAGVLDAESANDRYAVRTDANGSFAVTVPEGEYDVVALRDANVSRLRTVNATGNASVELRVVDERPLRYDASGGVANPGETASVTVSAYNRDADARTFAVAFANVPDDWAVESHGGNADSVDASAHVFEFEDVPSGDWATATLTVRVPESATRDERHPVEATVTSPTATPNATAAVRWEGTAPVFVPPNDTTPTTSLPGGDDRTGTTTRGGTTARTDPGTAATTTEPDPPTEPSRPGSGVPGFGVGLAVATLALLVAALAVGNRR